MSATSQFENLAKLYPKKRAIITGAGSGLGLALAKLLLNDDWVVLAIDINTSQLHELSSSKLCIYEFDITDRKQLSSAIQSFCDTYQGIDVMCNNAGVGEGVLFQDYSLENWDWIIDINLKAVIAGTYIVLPLMRKQNAGTIVSIASMAGIANLPQMSPYNVTKAAVVSLSETLAHELCYTKIKVKCIAPTFFQSNVLQHSKGDPKTIKAAQQIVSASKLSSDQAAYLILKQLHHTSEFQKFPFSANLFYYGRRYFPFLYRFLVRRFLVKKEW
jgi:NADP-dependent 3-hydroxy acid dehydrogenase YdfG